VQEILQGQIKADSKDAGAAALCLHLGGEMWHFPSASLDLYPCKPDSSASSNIQCQAGMPSTVFPPSHPGRQAAVTWEVTGELRGPGACGEGLPSLQSSEERRSPGVLDFAVPVVAQPGMSC